MRRYRPPGQASLSGVTTELDEPQSHRWLPLRNLTSPSATTVYSGRARTAEVSSCGNAIGELADLETNADAPKDAIHELQPTADVKEKQSKIYLEIAAPTALAIRNVSSSNTTSHLRSELTIGGQNNLCNSFRSNAKVINGHGHVR